jgi:hypothetical protein
MISLSFSAGVLPEDLTVEEALAFFLAAALTCRTPPARPFDIFDIVELIHEQGID